MKIISIKARYFQSYEELAFTYSNLGLTLISGETKAGKSTLLDAVCWALYGETSKDASSNDVRSWFSEKNKTEAELQVEVNGEVVTIIRHRGTAQENDLYILKGEDVIRGKDLKETQSALNSFLGIDFDSYILSSYLHQFSKADMFFTATPRERRQIFEKVADLSIPIQLSEGAAEKRKLKKKELDTLKKDSFGLSTQLAIYSDQRKKSLTSYNKWNDDKAAKLSKLENEAANFEQVRKQQTSELVSKIEFLSKEVVPDKEIEQRKESMKLQLKAFQAAKNELKTIQKENNGIATELAILESKHAEHSSIGQKCPMCLNDAQNPSLHLAMKELMANIVVKRSKLEEHYAKQQELEKAVSVEPKILEAYDKLNDLEAKNNKMLNELNNLNNLVQGLRSSKNTFGEQAEVLSKEQNPYTADMIEVETKLEHVQNEIGKNEELLLKVQEEIAVYTWIYDKSFELRSHLLDQARIQIQHKTNELISAYFEGALKIKLSFDDTDKLEIEIENNGYKCPYKQLSGGERCLLRLCFYLCLSEFIQNSRGVRISCIMLDEALNGLNPALKNKAFTLLQSLETSYDSIFVIDHHEEFKELFGNKYLVENTNGISSIYSYEP